MRKVRGTPITINRGGTNKRDKKRDFLKSIKKQLVKQAKQQFCTCSTLFMYISLPFLHDYDVKMPNFALQGEFKPATAKFYSPS